MKREVIKYELSHDGKKIKKGKLKLYIPHIKGLSKYISKLPDKIGTKESIFVLNMLDFHFMFPADDIFLDKNIKYEELQYMLQQKEKSNIISIKYDDLIYKSLLNDRIFKINMTPEEYEDFRLMILNEISDIKNEYSDLFDSELIRLKKQQNIIKRIKLAFKNKEFMKFKKRLITEMIQNINKDAIILDNKKAEYRFYEKAFKLIEKYNEEEYDELIKDVTDYLNREYEECNNYQEYKEECKYINSGRSMGQKFEILIWICSNMSPRAESLDAMRLDATYIYDQILNNYYRVEYKKIRHKMNYEEKRLFQLFFFGRKAFLYKVPIFTQFMKSFFNANSELIFLGLILKKSNPNYREDNNELTRKWYEFLNIYSIGIKNYNIIENMENSNKIKNIIQTKFCEDDSKILECVLENYSYDIIQATFNKDEEYIRGLIKDLQYEIRSDSYNGFIK